MSKYNFKTKPYAHQRKALELSWNKEDYALFMEMGTGKTKVAIDTAGILYSQGKIDAVLVLCPKALLSTWVDNEVPTHCGVPYQVEAFAAGMNKTDQAAVLDLLRNDEVLKFCVMNIEGLITDKAAKFAADYVKTQRTMIIVDESTVIKNRKARRTKEAMKLAELARYRRILTGLPTDNSPLDLYAQCAFLNPRLLGHSSFFSFRNTYAIMKKVRGGPPGAMMILGYRKLDLLAKKIEPFSFRVTKDECLDLPPKVYVRRPVEMTPEQFIAYREMRTKARLELEKAGTVTVDLVLTQMLRLHQIACGFVKLDDTEEGKGGIHPLPNHRIDELMHLIEESGSNKVIIWCNYKQNLMDVYDALRKAYGDLSVLQFHGGTGKEARATNIHRFQNDPRARFFLGNPQTGGYGLTLTAADLMIYYSNSHRLADRLQSEDRAHRIGQDRSLTIVDLVIEKTVDAKIIESLREKKNLAGMVLGENEWKAWI